MVTHREAKDAAGLHLSAQLAGKAPRPGSWAEAARAVRQSTGEGRVCAVAGAASKGVPRRETVRSDVNIVQTYAEYSRRRGLRYERLRDRA